MFAKEQHKYAKYNIAHGRQNNNVYVCESIVVRL